MLATKTKKKQDDEKYINMQSVPIPTYTPKLFAYTWT